MEVCHDISCRFSWFLHANKDMTQVLLQIIFTHMEKINVGFKEISILYEHY